MVLGRRVNGPRQVWSHRAPGLTQKSHALCQTIVAPPTMPSHSTLHPRPGVGSLGAHVGTLSLRCDAAALGADQAGRLRPHRYYSSLISPSAFMPYYSGRPPGHGHRRCACAGGSRLTPGGGQVMPRARGLLGVLGAAPPAIPAANPSRGVFGSRLKPRCDPARRPRPRPRRLKSCPGLRRVRKVPRRLRNGQGAATRCLRLAGPGRPEGWLEWADFSEALLIKIKGRRNA